MALTVLVNELFLKYYQVKLNLIQEKLSFHQGKISCFKAGPFEFDEHEVIKTVMMGHVRLFEIMKEKDDLYAKSDLRMQTELRASELEGEFAELNGWEAESEASTLTNGPWYKLK